MIDASKIQKLTEKDWNILKFKRYSAKTDPYHEKPEYSAFIYALFEHGPLDRFVVQMGKIYKGILKFNTKSEAVAVSTCGVLDDEDWNKLVDLCTEFMNGKVEK